MYYSCMYYYVFFNLGNYALYCVDWTIRSCCHISKAGNFKQGCLDPLNLKQNILKILFWAYPISSLFPRFFVFPTDVGEECLLHTSPRRFFIILSAKYNFLVKRHLRQFNIMTNHLNGRPELVLIGKDCRIMVYIMAKIWLNPLCNFGSLEFQNWSSTKQRNLLLQTYNRLFAYRTEHTYYKARFKLNIGF